MSDTEREIWDKFRRHLLAQAALIEQLLAEHDRAKPPAIRAADAARRRERECAGPSESKAVAAT